MSTYESFRVNSPKVVSETIDGEVVIVNLDKGNYYSLLKTGHTVWSELEKGLSRDDVITNVISRYDGFAEEITHAVNAFIDQLLEENLIVAESAQTQTAADVSVSETHKAGSTEKFEPPTLEKFSDMEDLLLLDPIHEVDEEAGWPAVKATTDTSTEAEKTPAA